MTMSVLHHVYIGKLSSTPNNWSTGDEASPSAAGGWIYLISRNFLDKVDNKDRVVHSAGHTSIRINTGKFIQSMAPMECIIRKVDGVTDSDHYNKVKEFLLKHMASGGSYGYDLYLFVYDVAGEGQYVKWIDSGEVMREYIKVKIKSFQFKASQRVWEGNIVFEEV